MTRSRKNPSKLHAVEVPDSFTGLSAKEIQLVRNFREMGQRYQYVIGNSANRLAKLYQNEVRRAPELNLIIGGSA